MGMDVVVLPSFYDLILLECLSRSRNCLGEEIRECLFSRI